MSEYYCRITGLPYIIAKTIKGCFDFFIQSVMKFRFSFLSITNFFTLSARNVKLMFMVGLIIFTKYFARCRWCSPGFPYQ